MDATAERALIGRVFRKRGNKTISQTFTEAQSLGVTVEWFSDPLCRAVWEGAIAISTEKGGKEMSIITLRNSVQGAIHRHSDKESEYKGLRFSEEFLDDCARLVDREDEVSPYVDALRSAYVMSRIEDEMSIVKDAFASGEDVVSVASAMQSKISEIISGASPASEVKVSSVIDKIIADAKDVRHHVQDLGEYGYTTGIKLPWRPLQKAFGGFNPGLHIIAARPSVGKTSFVLQLCRYWIEHGVKVCLNTLDMNSIELFKRQIADSALVGVGAFASGLADDGQMEELIAAGEKIKKWSEDGLLTVYHESDVDKLKAQAKILHDQNRMDVLVIDYIQKLSFRGCERAGEYGTVTRCSKVLHSIMLDLNIPVVALAQLNRDSTKDGGREPEMSDLRSSGQIEQDAYTISILHRDMEVKNEWKNNPPSNLMYDATNNDELKAIDPIKLIVAKAQNGQAGRQIPFVVYQSKFTWYLGDYKSGDAKDKYMRVHDDWRHNPMEKFFAKNGVLISSRDEMMLEIENVNVSRLQRGMAPLPVSRRDDWE